jgi:hypothetical protein
MYHLTPDWAIQNAVYKFVGAGMFALLLLHLLAIVSQFKKNGFIGHMSRLLAMVIMASIRIRKLRHKLNEYAYTTKIIYTKN